MEKIKICFTSPSVDAYSETFIQNLKEGLEGELFHCYGGLFPNLTLNGRLQSFKTPPLKDIVLQRLGIIKRPLREHYLIKYLKENQINLIFCNYGPAGAELAPIARELNIPLVVHFHGYDASVTSVLAKYKDAYLRLFEIAKRIIVVSKEMKLDLLGLGAPEFRLIKITYAPHSRFLALKPSLQSNQMISIGRFVEKKAPYLTLLAFKRAKEKCPELSLKMVGDGDLLPICRDLCIALNINGVEFLGIQTPDQIAKLMENSFCFVQHSKQASNGDKEGTPVAILEAMAAGLPIISTRHAGIPDIVFNGKNGFLVNEGDIYEMANGIIELYLNRRKAEMFGRKGKEFISTNLEQNGYFKKVNSIIKEVVNHG
ncbi:glycosyltransferase [Algoriphagus zhangzhouensis]|uniref:Glycosyltransferase involved in cell wall bisynthesis n=1 Tax=Algoriphagus zhangzhouensis TaxID=1073327 RepID=A0A1M7ZKF2_9BACT|nr:glycosyltransferase [Algoriphagus zhangzhouensis]TDY42877.1 glycosyltransferase involved in cell wall biosynthesis [Algoriphagus zhangzhouensis]SHO65390.1 Glycosyltransferase involved in cell wall bisynthesis [Algoriphagus zhangzhouensis]